MKLVLHVMPRFTLFSLSFGRQKIRTRTISRSSELWGMLKEARLILQDHDHIHVVILGHKEG